jgi:D-alanyl-D-alanine carboxypeptidase/D-alanyl-D-alanine-endopeptidase (penicillin-binding protein 4)
MFKKCIEGFLVFLFLYFWGYPVSASIKTIEDLGKFIGNKDAVLVVNDSGKVLYAKNEKNLLIPASTLKLLTSLVAIHYLGENYRFRTEFYMDRSHNLTIKGYGDPMLISEVVDEICKKIAFGVKKSGAAIKDIILDDSYFEQPLIIPGISTSNQPYDAPNGALCVNFNTVCFRRDPDNTYLSAEPQTPLLPCSLEKIRQTGLDHGRIVLSQDQNEMLFYAGALFRYFLKQNGVSIHGSIQSGKVNPETDALFFTYFSQYSLKEIIKNLMAFSNNFIANQLLIAAGIKACNSPGNLEKGILAARQFAQSYLDINNMRLVEGSGISRNNRISAEMMINILDYFAPYYQLMPSKRSAFFKTGTLQDISTLAGYIENPNKAPLRFVIMKNSPGLPALSILEKLLGLKHF